MDRRSYLGALAAAGAAGTAGCLDSISAGDGGNGGDDSATALGPPERDGDPEVTPTHGDEFPDFSIPDPLAGEEVSLDDFTGERAFLMTFIYTSCPDGCGRLGRTLQLVQEDAADRGYGDDVAFLAMTFDPETDDAEALREYGQRHEVDLEAGNWHFLRPETEERALSLVNDTFGAPVTVEVPEDHDHGEDGHDHNESHDHGDDGHDHDHGGVDPETTTHYLMIFLVNDRGIVERAYPNAVNYRPQEIIDDTRTVVE